MELEQCLLDKSDVQQSLVKLESVCNSLDQDKRRLQEELRKVIIFSDRAKLNHENYHSEKLRAFHR